MTKSLRGLLFAVLLISMAGIRIYAGTLTGQIQFASSGRGVPNGTLTFNLSQAAIVAGTATVVTSGVNCYTDALGNIVGLPNPLAAPALSSNGSGSLPAGAYFVRTTWANSSGETVASPERNIVTTVAGALVVQVPANPPANATQWKIYIGTATGTETLQSTQAAPFANYAQSTALVNGAALPSANTSVCSLRFNDELQPSYTGYNVTFTTTNGAAIPGFPQKWYLAGGTVNVSNGTPLYSGTVVYPQAIVTMPAGNALQSISGPLSIGGFTLTAGAINCKSMAGIRCADQFAGSDCGAKIAAADSDFSAKGGIIIVNRACGMTISTWPATGFFGGGNSPQHSIWFVEGGTWSVSTTLNLQHGGIGIYGSGLNDASGNPSTMLQWTGAGGQTQDMISILGTALNRLDVIEIDAIMLDGNSGAARFTVRAEKIDDLFLGKIRIKQGGTAGLYVVDSTGTKLRNTQLAQCPSYCLVADWATGGFSWVGGNVDVQVSNSNPAVLFQGNSTGIHIEHVEHDSPSAGTFAGFIQINGFDVNSSIPSAPTGGAGAPASVQISQSTFITRAGSSAPTQGADILITGTVGNLSNKVSLDKLTFSGLSISQAAVRLDQTQFALLTDILSSAHTTSTIVMTNNASTIGAEWVVLGTDPARCTGAGCGVLRDITQKPGGVWSSNNPVNSDAGFRVSSLAPSGNVLRGNGTNFISAPLAAADLSNGVSGSGPVPLQTSANLITPTIGGGATLNLYKTVTDSPGAITVNANTCTDRGVALAGTLTTATIIPTANYTFEANLFLSAGQTVAGTPHYRICNVTAGNITLNAAATFNLAVWQ